MSSEKKILIIASLSIGTFALALIAIYSSWQIALGVFLALFAQNIDNSVKKITDDEHNS